MNWIYWVAVYLLLVSVAGYRLYLYGENKKPQSREQDESDAEMIRDPTQRISVNEWMIVLVSLAAFAIALWVIDQYFSDILFAIRGYVNLL